MVIVSLSFPGVYPGSRISKSQTVVTAAGAECTVAGAE